MLDWIRPQRFRGFSDLCIDPLRRFNIIVGCNGTGKTSLLEAVSLVTGSSPAEQISRLSNCREFSRLRLGGDEAIRSLFFNLDLTSHAKISSSRHGVKADLFIEALFGVVSGDNITFQFPPPDASNTSAREDQGLSGINILVGSTPTSSLSVRMLLTPEGYQLHQLQTQLETHSDALSSTSMSQPSSCFYIHARRATSINETASVLTRLIEEKREDIFTRAMRSFDSRVVTVIPGSRADGAMVLVDIGLPKLIPINVLGDGFCRLALIITGTISRRAKTLVVDEIDSGLHHSVMPGVWKSLISLATEADTQVFATTHSDSMLHAVKEAFADHPDELSVIRLQRDSSGEVFARVFGYSELASALDAGLEIR